MYEKLENKLINKAYLFALEKHSGQKYGDQEFIYHPEQTYSVITLLSPKDINLRIAALLHDTIEDTATTKAEIQKEFNKDVAELVQEVTSSSYNTFPNLHTFRGVVLLTASRLCNMTNMHDWSEEKKRKYFFEKSKYWKS